MIARLQRLITLALFFASLSWSGVFFGFGHPVIAIVGTIALVFGYSFFLAAEFLAVLVVDDSAEAVRAVPRELLQAWWGEVRASPRVFFWRQPFRTHAEPDALPSRPDGRRGVLLVHGFVCNRAFWNPWMAALRRAGISFLAVDLEPPFESISGHARTIDAAVDRLTAATGVAPLIVAHSMGGLAVRHWLAAASSSERAHHIITIGTPHRGTWLARLSRTVPGTEMAMNSNWLRQIEVHSSPDCNALFTCFYGNADNVVFPSSHAALVHADNRLVRATAHVQLAFHPHVFEEALRRLA